MKKGLLALATALMLGSGMSEAANPALYVRGAQAGWGTQTGTTYKFTENNGVYTLKLANLAGSFKIAAITSTGGWDDNHNYGGDGAALNVELEKEYTLGNGSGSKDMNPDGNWKDVTLTFNITTRKLKVTGTSTPSVISYQIWGQFTNANWGGIDLTEKDGKWVSAAFTPTSATGEFGVRKMENGQQAEWWSGTSDQTLKVGTPVSVVKGGSKNVKFECDKTKSYTLTFDLTAKTVTMDEAGSATFPESIYVIGNVNGKDFKPNNGIQMTKTGEGVYTCDATIGDAMLSGFGYFAFAEKLGTDATDASWSQMGARYGAKTKDLALVFTDKTATADLAGGENSFKVAANKTLTITADLKNMKLTAVEKGATPVPPTVTYAVVGSMNDWTPEKAINMEKKAENVYTATFPELAANTEFKIAKLTDGKFDWNATYGPEYNGEETENIKVAVNINGDATNSWICANNFLIEKAVKDATITFTYVEGNNVASLVKVEGTVEEIPADLTATIDFADYTTFTPDYSASTWTADGGTGNEYIVVNDTYLKATDADVQICGLQGDAATPCRLYRTKNQINTTTYRIFKMGKNGTTPSSINVEVGSKYKINKIEIITKDTRVPSLPEGALGTLASDASTTTWTAPADGTVTKVVLNGQPNSGGTIAIKKITVTYAISTGVENIVDASEDAPVYYYNLQGVRVENPSNGIFIRVQGKKSQKVMF